MRDAAADDADDADDAPLGGADEDAAALEDEEERDLLRFGADDLALGARRFLDVGGGIWSVLYDRELQVPFVPSCFLTETI